ncbi:hypothetical protein [Alteribacillus sp. HJP-4]
MAWLHVLQHTRIIAVGLLSLTAASLFTFQSIEITQAFMSFFTDLFQKK